MADKKTYDDAYGVFINTMEGTRDRLKAVEAVVDYCSALTTAAATPQDALRDALQESRTALIAVLGTAQVEAHIQPDLRAIIEDAIKAGKAALTPPVAQAASAEKAGESVGMVEVRAAERLLETIGQCKDWVGFTYGSKRHDDLLTVCRALLRLSDGWNRDMSKAPRPDLSKPRPVILVGRWFVYPEGQKSWIDARVHWNPVDNVWVGWTHHEPPQFWRDLPAPPSPEAGHEPK